MFKLILQVIFLAVFLGVSACSEYETLKSLKVPRYESGESKGAKFCGNCHQQIYNEWKTKSRHAIATTNESFLSFKKKITDSFMLNVMFGEEMCFACHGNKESDEGVNCEICHGLVIPGVPITETHERKFIPGRAELKKSEFCAKCHELEQAMTVYSDWQNSAAASNNITCQQCHMKPLEGQKRYHGFDTIVISKDIYRDDLAIENIKIHFPEISLSVVNNISGHAIPAAGPSRVLALTISLLDQQETELYSISESFTKKFSLIPIAGIMPYKLIENTQLQSNETRKINLTIPESFKEKAKKVVISLKIYEVSDDHQGDITKAHWISEPIVYKEIHLKNGVRAPISRK